MAFGAIWWVGRSSPWPAVRRGTPLILAALLGGIAFLNINTYFGDQARHPAVYADFSTDETLVGRHMKEQRRRGYNLYASGQYQFSAVIGVAGDTPEYEVIRAPIGIPIDATQVGRGASIYLEPREGSVYRLLRTYYPDGLFEEVRPPGGGEVLYYLAVVEKDQLEQRQGLNAVYTLADGTLRGATLPTTEAARLLDLGAEDVPFDLVWQGALLVSVPGEYQLSLQGNAPAEVMLDGRRLLWSGRTSVRIEPAVGLHSLEVTARVEEPASVLRLRWKPPDSELVAIPTRNLYRGTVRPVGLAGRFYSGGIEAGPADALRVTPALDTFDYNPVIPEPYLGVWEGTLDAPASGLYRFQVAGTGSVKLFLNGNLRAQNPGSDSNEGVPLSAGGNRIRVEYLSESPPSNFEVLWGPPGAPLGPIPIDRLTPDPERMFRLVSDGE